MSSSSSAFVERPPHGIGHMMATAYVPDVAHPGLNAELIRNVVATFYGRARADSLIGPIFEAAVSDWDRHVGAIADFWSGMLLRTSRYDGRPLRPHLMLPLKGEHFDRWLAIFEATVRELCPPEFTGAFIERARRIADSFEMAIASHHGEIAAPRHAGRSL